MLDGVSAVQLFPLTPRFRPLRTALRISTAIALAMAFKLTCPTIAAGQAGSSASLTGQVVDPSDIGVARALVTVSSRRGGAYTETATDVSGRFRLPLLSPGIYELRIEALGYRPLVVTDIAMQAGETLDLTLPLTPASPPVLYVDTMEAPAGGTGRPIAAARQLDGSVIADLPYRRNDVASIAALSTFFDESLGSQGLPGDMTLLFADGLPFYRAPVPATRSELVPTPLFARPSVSGALALPNPTDIEWSGAGGQVGLSPVPSSLEGKAEVEGAYSAGPLWASDQIVADERSPTSYEARGRGAVDLAAEQVQLFAAGELVKNETPLAAQVDPDLEPVFGGVSPELFATLSEAGLEDYTRYSGLVRMDATPGLDKRLFLRGAFARSERSFDGVGPISLLPGAPREESTDFSVAAGLTMQSSPSLTYDLKAGVSGSYRDFGLSISGREPAAVTGAGVRLGSPPSTARESSRTDFVMLPTLRYSPGWDPSSTLKFGTWVRASRHSMQHSRAEFGDLVYPDGASLSGTAGHGLLTSTPAASFGTQEFGVFGQWEGIATPGLLFRFGARYDYERMGGTQPRPDTDWLAVSGIANEDYPDSFHQVGIQGSLTWEPGASGDSRFDLQAGLHHGDVDPRAVHEVLGSSLGATVSRFDNVEWASDALPPGGATELPTLTLFGPDTQAPRSMSLNAAFSQRVGGSVTLQVVGTLRRTDYLLRRRNLNLPIAPLATDPNGQPIFGELIQDGSTVTAVGDDNRRFGDFGEVWALDPDGWSEYQGITGILEHDGPLIRLLASYTYSRTTDNWVGAGGESIDDALRRPPSSGGMDEAWDEGRSDYDVPHRATVAATLRIGPVAASGFYRMRSGKVFTPGYRVGVDANGDGSFRNDVAFVPEAAELGALSGEWSCLMSQQGTLAGRNSCRASMHHSLDARLALTTRRIGTLSVGLFVDVFNLLESDAGTIDDALLLVDPAGTITTTSGDGSTITIPLVVNERFGDVLYPWSRGRMIRIGLRIAG